MFAQEVASQGSLRFSVVEEPVHPVLSPRYPEEPTRVLRSIFKSNCSVKTWFLKCLEKCLQAPLACPRRCRLEALRVWACVRMRACMHEGAGGMQWRQPASMWGGPVPAWAHSRAGQVGKWYPPWGRTALVEVLQAHPGHRWQGPSQP